MPEPPWDEGRVIDIGGRSFRIPPTPRLSFGAWKGILAALVGVILLFTTYYQLEPEEVGVVQRFGAYVRTTDPGPHLKLPFGIERVTKVPVQRQLKMEFGFRTLRSAARSEFATPPEAQAEATESAGPLAPWSIPTNPAAPLGISMGIRNGLARRGPPSETSMMPSSKEPIPPIAAEITVPTREAFISVISRPESFNAWETAAAENSSYRSRRLISRASR